MNRAEFESKYKAKYLNNLHVEGEAELFIDESRTDEGYIDDHLNVCWRDYVKQCAIDDFCDHYDRKFGESIINSCKEHSAFKALFDLRSKEV